MLQRPTRRNIQLVFACAAALILLALSSAGVQAQTYRVIHNFKGFDGATPYGGLVMDSSGNLFGTTYLGGSYGAGTVYELSFRHSTWTYSRLYSLKAQSDGSGPAFGTLAMGANGSLFGTTEGGGIFGTVFKVWPRSSCSTGGCPWNETVVHRFGSGHDGAQPIGGVVLDHDGNIYGTTSIGGVFGLGTVFEISPSGQTWTEQTIYSFKLGTDAFNPVSAVTLDAEGNIYGTTTYGGDFGFGTVYKLSRSGGDWVETILYSFQGADDGQNPVGGVIFDQAGNLYGTTFLGGANSGGTVYQLSPSASGWTCNVLYSLTGFSGPYNKLTFDTHGNLYGFTNGEGANGLGSIFKLSPAGTGWSFTDLHDFAGGNDGALPYGSLVVNANGTVFGTAAVGGTQNQGVVFEITP